MKVLKYTDSNLAEALSNDYTDAQVIKSKNHYTYFIEYLGETGLKARTIVVERDYVNKDFLIDYSTYYAFCFEEYPKFCDRIHLFENEFEKSDFEEVILDKTEDQKEFWDNYLGFIVVKPIPTKVIGYSVLKTYNQKSTEGIREYWGNREYNINVFGNKLKLTSLAFQEQDTVLAACATTAIWSMLNKASIDYHTILKSPSQITKDAAIISHDGSRLFPNKGLDILQICQAIFNSGLVSEVKSGDIKTFDNSGEVKSSYISNTYLKKIINAYSPIGIPLILVVEVPSAAEYGLHAVTVNGSIRHEISPKENSEEISWVAENITKLYAHDDQWGPFSRINFKGDERIETPWTIYDSEHRITKVVKIIIPLYPKIRISYEDIERIVLGLDTILNLHFVGKTKFDLSWDIQIDYSENFKRTLKDNRALTNQEKQSLLMKSMPKYIWVASCYIGKNIVFQFTYDATDINNGMMGLELISYLDDSANRNLRLFLEGNKFGLNTNFSHPASKRYYDFLIKKMSEIA